MKASLKDSLELLDKLPDRLFHRVMRHGTMSVEIYKPNEKDLQTAHRQDEIYIVISGSGNFINDGKLTSFLPGDVLFVPAGIDHRFVDFSSDFATWVIFYGPIDGEQV
ncbi:cupin domain-containing protein [Pedobacter sp. HMF7647]|uniref:Cupin domain-containing protein n=1 Tax=Hufsiella arboris TaxID=2695275 RepID=A0A7K1Y755_9SPHI|nr:cupin domain-containing protein [Hufsiella arboris]MXV50241.1 cupin domain-containing protein [Hufsiella arboris]